MFAVAVNAKLDVILRTCVNIDARTPGLQPVVSPGAARSFLVLNPAMKDDSMQYHPG